MAKDERAAYRAGYADYLAGRWNSDAWVGLYASHSYEKGRAAAMRKALRLPYADVWP